MRRFSVVSAVLTLAACVIASAGVLPVHAQQNDRSHLKLTSSAPHGFPSSHVDLVINNAIEVTITASRDCPNHDEVDWGVLTLAPGGSPDFTWTCTNCTYGYLTANSVLACDQAGGCQTGDVEGWLVGVQTYAAHGIYCNAPDLPDEVNYFVDSDDLGNGKRHHVSPADCSTTVTPVDDTYSETDPEATFDSAPHCSDNGVAIDLAYQ
jgi:hypothetical protein